jgi:serpin B
MLPTFTKSALDGYGSPVAPVDFVGNTEGSRKTINGWVEKQTHDKIKDLLPEGSVTPGTSLVITNAIYFKGKWATAFSKSSTYDQAFLVDGTTSKDVSMMHQTSDLGFGHTAGVKVLEMKYDKSDLAMDVLLPDDAKGLGQLEAGLTPASFAGYVTSVSPQKVIVTFPKATFTWGGPMSKPLESLGMGTAFGGGADFSNITGHRDVNISEVVHKAFVAIDEEGTEAAAATGVIMKEMITSIDRPVPPPEFKADHPFVFVIRDVKRGRILFMGRVTSPKA